jgi:hypothetical protein
VRPWLLLLFFGSATLGAWLLIGPALAHGRYYKVGFNRSTYEYARPLFALFIPYALALFAWVRGSRVPLWVLLAGAVVLHILVLFAPLPQSQDFYQYLFYGRMQAAHGANPYVVSPSVFWADQWFPWIRWSQQTSVYGPVWLLTSWGAAKVAGANLALGFVLLKLVILGIDLGIMALLVSGSRERSDPAGAAGFGILAYAWNPLILITVPLGGSADVALGAALVGAILARRRGRTGLATVLLTLGALVKIYGVIGIVLHLVLVYRERGSKEGLKHTAGALGIAAAAYAPYWHGIATFNGLFTALPLTNQSLAGTLQIFLGRFVHLIGFHHAASKAEVLMRVLAGAGLLAVVARAVVKVRDDRTLWHYTMVVFVAYLYLTPWFLYWYMLAPLAMVAVLPSNAFTYPMLVFSGTSLFSIGTPRHLKNLLPQTVIRYAPPAFVYSRWPLRARAAQRSSGSSVKLPAPSTVATVQPAPAAK